MSNADYYTLSVKLYNLGNLFFEVASYASLIQTFTSLHTTTLDTSKQVVFIMPCICPTSHRNLQIGSVLINLIGGSMAKLESISFRWYFVFTIIFVHFLGSDCLQSLNYSRYSHHGVHLLGSFFKSVESWGIHPILLRVQWQCT